MKSLLKFSVTFLILFVISCNKTNVSSINILEGKWQWDRTMSSGCFYSSNETPLNTKSKRSLVFLGNNWSEFRNDSLVNVGVFTLKDTNINNLNETFKIIDFKSNLNNNNSFRNFVKIRNDSLFITNNYFTISLYYEESYHKQK